MIKRFIKKTREGLNFIKQRVMPDRPSEENELPAKLPQKLKDETPAQKVQISATAGTMAKFVSITILLLLLTAFLYRISDILVLFFVALLFAAALDPLVDSLEAKKIPRGLGVVIIYVVILFLLALLISNLVPIVASEVAQLAVHIQDFVTNTVKNGIELPSWLAWLQPSVTKFLQGLDVSQISNYKDVLLNIAQHLSDVAGNVLNGLFGVFNGFFNTIIVLVITFMMTIDEQGIDRFILSIFPSRHAPYIQEKSRLIKEKMGYWLRGQIVLCIIIGVLVYVGLLIIGVFTEPVQYSATIALVAGFTEAIPYVGPVIALLIALPIAANQSFVLVISISIMMYIVQLLENNVIVPLVMKKAVGISPIFVMFSMFVGYSILGIVGMILAVPVATGIGIFLKDYTLKAK
ncbi:AI-2E family transporter [Candidatus Gracilibacteria bacterium]|nr:AI-2E family transporter [Candidatus Gracilibacteria bacterium]